MREPVVATEAVAETLVAPTDTLLPVEVTLPVEETEDVPLGVVPPAAVVNDLVSLYTCQVIIHPL